MCVVYGIGREQKDVVVEAVDMWSGSVSVSCPHVHSRGGIQEDGGVTAKHIRLPRLGKVNVFFRPAGSG